MLDVRGPPFDDSIELYLQRRRYTPVTYKGKPVLVPYTFLVSFNPPPAELARTSAVRIEVFRALLFRLRGPAADAGSARPLVCVGVGDDVADPPRNEMDALARAGAQVEPASSCWGLMQTVGGAAPFGSIAVRDVRFEQPDVAEVRAEIGVSGQSPEFLVLRASRLGGTLAGRGAARPCAGRGRTRAHGRRGALTGASYLSDGAPVWEPWNLLSRSSSRCAVQSSLRSSRPFRHPCRRCRARAADTLHAGAARPCAADVARLCPNAQGRADVHACLQQNADQVSAECKARIDQAHQKFQAAREACQPDVAKFCADVQPGGHRVAACLRDHASELSQACQAAIPAKKGS